MAAELGSFTKAAEVSGYTQSGLTHMMNSLEKEMGFQLLDRGHNGVYLTDQGEKLIPAIKEFLIANANLDNTIKEVRENKREAIKIAAYASITMQWLPGIIYEFKRDYPNVDMDIRMIDDAVEPYELLEQGRMDIVYGSRQSEGRYDWIPLYEEALYAVLPEDFPVKNKKSFDVRDFYGQEFIMPYGGFDPDAMHALGDVADSLKITRASVDDSTVIRMVGHGLGVSIMAELMLRDRTHGVGVKCIPIKGSPKRELGMAVRSYDASPQILKDLVECSRRLVPEFGIEKQ